MTTAELRADIVATLRELSVAMATVPGQTALARTLDAWARAIPAMSDRELGAFLALIRDSLDRVAIVKLRGMSQ
jgi:hypothetical protein